MQKCTCNAMDGNNVCSRVCDQLVVRGGKIGCRVCSMMSHSENNSMHTATRKQLPKVAKTESTMNEMIRLASH
eukprot:1668381-Lingulodinium_polyedra.AAC.1